MKTKLHYVFSLTMLLLCFSGFSQKNDWKKSNSTDGTSKFHLNNDSVHSFELNSLSFKQSLSAAPLRGKNETSQVSIIVPAHDGNFESFTIYEAPVFSPTLSARYPDIKSYVGFSNDNTGAQLRMSVSPQGVQTMITYIDKEAVFMMPVSHESNRYLLYNKSSRGNYVDEFQCFTEDEFHENLERNTTVSRDADDQTLRTYRLAVSVNGEYTQYHGGTVNGALAGINATLTRVNAVFETDMAISFELVDANQLIFTNAATDPYSTLGNWNVELQNTLTNTIGNAAYDIGHMFGASGGGGNAGCIGCVCEDDTASTTDENKGAGITSPADGIPEGDNFDIDYVAHEIGHQMGANHTFSHNTEGTGVNAEPGSGTTIMGYAGITGANNVEQHSDPYFHYHSINQILNNVDTAPNNCAATTAIGNNPPVADAGPASYNIPPGTAYVLRGSATDADGGDSLTYCWEQTDSGQVTNTSFGPTLTSGSMNRSLPPSTSPDRYIPRISRVVANELTETGPTLGSPWETVSTVARTMNWALTVRDREPSATGLNGQSSFDLIQINVTNDDPFTVASPNGSEVWTVGATQTVTWNVGQTSQSGAGNIDCQNVNIKLSVDGGFTYPYTLISNTPNDGTEDITVPAGSLSTMARVMVEAADNIFFDISNQDFNINTNDPDFYFVNNSGDLGTCGATSVTYNFDHFAINGFTETTNYTATGNPAGSTVTITPNSLSADGQFTVEIGNLGGIAEGDYTITVTGTATTSKNVDILLTVINGLCASVANTTYETSTTLVQFGDIDNASGKPSGYSDYTAAPTATQTTDVNRESDYDLTVNQNTDGNYTCVTTVWIDWNQNCIFDANESYDLGSATNTPDGPAGNSPLTVTIPADAALGSTTMRVTTKYNSGASACENGHDAEVEDYTINVLTSLSVDEFSEGSISVYPNPNNGEFNVKLNSTSNNAIGITVYDMRGRKVYNNMFQNVSNFNKTINLGNIQSGMYLMYITDGEKAETKKIIVR